MNIKLTTPGQVALLHEGDMIKRFPYNSTDGPAEKFDESRPTHTAIYKIKAINRDTDMFSLITENFKDLVFAFPVDIGRLFIKGQDLIAQKVWWINS